MAFRFCLTSLVLLVSSAAFSDELTLHFFPSPLGIRWDSPRSLTRSVVANALTPKPKEHRHKHEIGHVSVELKCEGRADILTGMTNADPNEDMNLLLKKQVGLGIIFHDFKGRLQNQEEIAEDLEDHYSSGYMTYVTFQINSKTCDRLVQYFKEYRDAGYGSHYGLANRPLKGEGAGCSAFGVSFLQVAGLLEPWFVDGWSKLRSVPEHLIASKNHKVSLFHLLFDKDAKSWSTEDQAHKDIFFWDPDAMHTWTMNTWQEEYVHPTGKFKVERRGNARGLVFDRIPAPTPEGPIWENP